jgi:ribosome-dependent ATPase
LRLFAYARREALEVMRDPVRLTFALLGIGASGAHPGLRHRWTWKISNSPCSTATSHRKAAPTLENMAGSRYFLEQPALTGSANSIAACGRRTERGAGNPARFRPRRCAARHGRDRRLGRRRHAFPRRNDARLRAGAARGLPAACVHAAAGLSSQPPARLDTRYRYNQEFRSVYAMVPAVIPLLLTFIPAILMAVGVVREKELGSDHSTCYTTPVTRLEFLLGKQLPYIVVSMISFYGLVALAIFVFEVPLQGQPVHAELGGAHLRHRNHRTRPAHVVLRATQIAALAGTAIVTMLRRSSFSG